MSANQRWKELLVVDVMKKGETGNISARLPIHNRPAVTESEFLQDKQ
jgi:hypothetical protein